MLPDLIGFLVCALIIFFSGKKLSYFGDIIAERSGLGKIWIGLMLMATVTSLPELITGVSAVRIVGSADLAVGNALGSCVFNLAILSLLDALLPRESLFTKVAQTQVLAATLGIILIALVGMGLFLENIVLLGWIGVMSILFIVAYLTSIKLLHSLSRRQTNNAQVVRAEENTRSELRRAVGWYAVHAVIVIGTSLVLPIFADRIALQSGLSNTFVGTLLLAASTSLPEIAVSLSAVRLGSIDLAVGNLFGSNIFNVLTLAVDDLFYTKGDLLKDASDLHVITVLSTIIMSSIAIAGLTFRVKQKRFILALDTLLILLAYVGNIVLLYIYRI